MPNQSKPNAQQMDALLRTAAGQLGMDPSTLKNAVESGSLDSLINNMSGQDAEKLRQALSDRNTAAKIIATPQAQAILKKLFERK